MLEVVAGLAGVALGTALPLAGIANLAYELAFGRDGGDDATEQRLIAAIDGWIASHLELVEEIGGGPIEGWPQRLIDGFNEVGRQSVFGSDPDNRGGVVDMISRAMFPPLTSSGWPASHRAAEALLSDLPRLVVTAAGQGELLSILESDLDEILDRVRELSERLPPTFPEELAIETYLAAVRVLLSRNRWARLIGGPEQSAEAMFLAREVRRHGMDSDEDVDRVADGCKRLVVLAEPGMGKSWVAQHLTVRAAALAAAADDGEAMELPLFAPAPAVLDAPSGSSPWDALTEAAVVGLRDLLGKGGAAAVKDVVDRAGGRYLVVLDGLDEAVRAADADRLERLAATPGRSLRLIVTSRPGGWRNQLEIDVGNLWRPSVGASSADAIVELKPLSDGEVRALVPILLPAGDSAAELLTEHLDANQDLSTFATNPLACVMLCIAVSGLGAVPRSRTQLVASVVTLLLRSTWRAGEKPETTEQAIDEAGRILRQMAATSAGIDGAPGDRWSTVAVLPAGAMISEEVRRGIDSVAPVTRFDPLARAQARRFIHESVHAHLAAEHVASLDERAACERMRDRLWFDVNWAEVVPATLVLHPSRSALLRMLLDVEDGQSLQWADVQRLDGFGELRSLLRRLVRETEAGDWDQDCRDAITRAAHEELREWPWRSLRLALVRGDWPDDVSRDEHVAALQGGNPLWPTRDIRAGVAWLGLSDQERRASANQLAGAQAIVEPNLSERAAITLDVLCGQELDGERAVAAERLARQLEASLWFVEQVDALDVLGATPEQRQRVAVAVAHRLEALANDPDTQDPLEISGLQASQLVRAISRLSDDEQLQRRCAELVLDLLRLVREPLKLNEFSGAAFLLRRYADLGAGAIEHALSALENIDSYGHRQVRDLIDELTPAPELAPAVLRALLAPGLHTWPSLAAVLELADRLFRDLPADDADALRTALVERFAKAHVAELDPLARLIEVVAHAPSWRERAAGMLLERLRTTPVSVILSCATALRRFAEGDTRAGAAEILATHLAAERDPAMRFALAYGVLWFAGNEAVRRPALDAIVADLHVGGIWGYWQVQQWVESQQATAEERARVFDAMLAALESAGALSESVVASDLVEVPVDEERRRRAVAVLLERLQCDPGTHPYDWLLPAAALGASPEQLEAANTAVVEALPTMELHDGIASGLAELWRDVPLTEPQRAAAARGVAGRLRSLSVAYVRGVAALLATLNPDAEVLSSAIAALRARLEAAPSDQRLLIHAIHALDATFTVEPSEEELVSQLRAGFSLEVAEQLAASSPSPAASEEAIRLLVDWLRAGEAPWWAPDRLERLADDLRLGPEDIHLLVQHPKAADQAVRSIAASVRRRCSGAEWRAMLMHAAAP